jgi:hypothetical protein
MRSEPRAITSITDDDSNFAIEKGIQADFVGDNFSRAYGPLYYRLSTIMRYFNVNAYSEHYTDSSMHEERSVFFHLLLINLLAIYGMSFFIMYVLSKDWFWRLLGTTILTSSILANPVRSNLLFVAKPEHLIALLCCLSIFFSVKWLSEDNRNNFLLCIVLWAMSFSTKFITLHFFIGFLLVVFLQRRKSAIESYKLIFKFLFLFYFIIGFWQNFDVIGTVSYILKHNKNSSLIDMEFLKNNWLPLILSDFKWQLFAILIIAILFPLRDAFFNIKSIVYFGTITATGFFFLLSQQTKNPHSWYTFPFVSAAVVFLAMIFLYIENRFFSKRIKSVKKSIYFPIFALSVIPWIVPTMPETVFSSYKAAVVCRDEGRLLLKKIDDLLMNSSEKMIVDPVIPFPRKYNDNKVFMTYEMKLESLSQSNLRYVAIRSSYYTQYLNKNLYDKSSTINHVTDQNSTQAFYTLFYGKTDAIDSFGKSWTKIYQDGCTNEIWMKQ